MANLRAVCESSNFGKQKARLGDIRRLDDALDGFIWLASRGAEEFPLIAPDSIVRIAEVGPFTDDDGQLRVCMILFRIENDDAVELLWIEGHNA